MASKGPIIAAAGVTGALFFWRRKRKGKSAPGDAEATAPEELEIGETADADA